MTTPAPVTTDQLAHHLGSYPARVVVAWFGGQTLHVPATANHEHHPLARLLGRWAFRALVEQVGGGRGCSIVVEGPDRKDKLYRDRSIAESIAGGRAIADIAADQGLTVRRVEQIRADLVAAGWLEYAQGFSLAMAMGRKMRRSNAAEAPTLPDFFGIRRGFR